MFIIDDILLGIPLLAAAGRAVMRAASGHPDVVEDRTRTAGGCGNWDFPEVCGSWAPWDDNFDAVDSSTRAHTSATDISPTRTAGGPGYVPPGFENAREVFSEPDAGPRTAGGGGVNASGSGGVAFGGSGGATSHHAQFQHHHFRHHHHGMGYPPPPPPQPYPYPYPDPQGPTAALPPGGAYDDSSDDSGDDSDDSDDSDDGSYTAGGPAVGGFEGWGEVRTAGGPVKATAEQAATIIRGVVPAVKEGSNDPIQWTQLAVGPYQLMVSNEPVAVKGLRLPTSENDAIEVAVALGALPITPVISDARWAAFKQVPCQPLNDPRGAVINDPDQVVAYNERMGANDEEAKDGYWKEVTVSPTLKQSGTGSMAQYGFKNHDGTMYEHGGNSNHFNAYKDYSNTPTYVSRQALKNGVAVDLLDEYAAGGPLTGAAIEPWLISRLRGPQAT